MATLTDKQLQKRFSIISDAEKTLTNGLKTTQLSIFQEILKKLEKFDTTGGKFNYNAEANRLINELDALILKIIKESNYTTKVSGYLRDFEKVKDVNVKLHSGLNNINVNRIGLTPMQKQVQKQATQQLLGSGIDANFTQPIKRIIFDSVVSGSTIPEAESLLREFIRGNSERLGTLERYVGQVSRDSISQYDGLIQQRIGEEFDLDGVSYEGSLVKDSRAQCIRWVSKQVLKVSELEEEINWAYSNGSGMIPGTTPENFYSVRGGYNCRHFATAIRLT